MNIQELLHVKKCLSKLFNDNMKEFTPNDVKSPVHHVLLAIGEIDVAIQIEEKIIKNIKENNK